MTAPTLRPYQAGALDALAGMLLEHGQNRGLIKLPTGTGKTVMFAELLKWGPLADWLAQQPRKGARMLVVAHREELLDQAVEKIQRQNPGLAVSVEQGERTANRYSDVIVASIQTLAKMNFRRLLRLIERHHFNVVVVDEAHHAAAASYRTMLAILGFLPMADASDSDNFEAATHDDVALMTKALEGWDRQAPKDRLLVGVTATPNRSDAIGLGCVFQSIAYSYGLKEAIDDGWLAPIKPWVIETAESLDQVHNVRGDFNQRELAEAVNLERRNRLGLDAWQLYAAGMQTIAFAVDVAHAQNIATLAQEAGIAAEMISGETPKDRRRDILAAYRRREIQLIANCMVLTEGTDLPETSCILHFAPTQSPTLYEQKTGRGLRVHPDDPAGPARVAYTGALIKPECLVIDLVDVSRRHSLQAAPVLYGLPPGVKTTGDDLRKTADDLEALRERFPNFDLEKALAAGHFSVQELLDRATTFDVWAVPSLGAFGTGRALNWIKVQTDVYRISYPWQDGSETLQVSKDLLDHWEVICTLTPHYVPGQPPAPKRQRTLAAQVPTAEAAAGLAEAYVLQERRSVAKLKDHNASWRQRPASEKQIALLRRKRVPLPAGKLTMGAASDLIDLANARRSR